MTRLILPYGDGGCLTARRGRGRRFSWRYTSADIALLAEVDEAHEALSGPATQKILYREYFGPHLQSAQEGSYRERRTHFEKTRPTPVPIGERRRPRPEGRPGYLRVDTVH